MKISSKKNDDIFQDVLKKNWCEYYQLYRNNDKSMKYKHLMRDYIIAIKKFGLDNK